MGIELMVSIWPTARPWSENFKEMEERGYILRTDSGPPHNMDFLGKLLSISISPIRRGLQVRLE